MPKEFDVQKVGAYKVTLKGKSTLGELAQLPCTLFFNGYPVNVFTFHGSEGKETELEAEVCLYSRFAVLRLSVAAHGLELSEITFTFDHEISRL